MNWLIALSVIWISAVAICIATKTNDALEYVFFLTIGLGVLYWLKG